MYRLFLKTIVSIFIFGVNFSFVQARENVTEWYVKDFQADFEVYPDSTMLVTERIVADCGQCVGKHGIFRVVPVVAKTPEGDIRTPVELMSITDFSGHPQPFDTIFNRSEQTVTWKIGDPDVTVTGEHEYQIVYRVKNVIRDQGDFHEWYWNVLGNFWDMPIDSYGAQIHFPDTVTLDPATDLSVYSGDLGSRDSTKAVLGWHPAEHTLAVVATRELFPREGVTVSVKLPPSIFTPYHFAPLEQLAFYSQYLWFLIPFTVFTYLYRTWRRYGDDPEWNKPIIAEYELPAELTPLRAAALLKNGQVNAESITAAIVNLAVRGYVRLREESTHILVFTQKDFWIDKLEVKAPDALSKGEQRLMEKLFASGTSVALSQLRYKLNPLVAELGKLETKELVSAGYYEPAGFTYRTIFVGVGIVGIFTFMFFSGLTWTAPVSLVITWLLFIFFGALMPKRTQAGVELHAKLQGLKLYMEKAEQYRQQFHEREGSFERLLPVAILFGMTKEWIKKMRELYDEEYIARYHPVWFTGTNLGNFDAASFTSHMESISSAIAATTGTRSGSGGGGSSGGGGGGGGGGGW